MFCPKCGQQVSDQAVYCSNCGNTLKAVGNPPPSSAGQTENVPNYMVHSILTTFLCCMPVGVVAFVFAASVNSKLERGDIEAAKKASNNAKIWCIVSLVTGLLGYAFFIIDFALFAT